jgi:polar amino acid transport system ATP-binding protein
VPEHNDKRNVELARYTMKLLEANNIHKSFGDRAVLNGVTFGVGSCEACAVIGPSGEGKTTLLKCMNLLAAIDHGEIRFDGKVVITASKGDSVPRVETTPSALRERIGMVFQEWNLWPNMTIRENITLALRSVRGLSRPEAEQIASENCARVRITEKLDTYPHILSGGQKQRAAIARALAMNPDVLMLDEVTSALDPVLAAEVLDVMVQLKGDGRTLIVVTHHIGFARAIADQVLFLHGGRIAEAGPPGILDDPTSAELKWFLGQVRRSQ